MGKSHELFEAIKERLCEGYYSFGQPISVAELSATFGASRHPIMTALNQLQAAGLVRITPQVGCEVVSLSDKEICDFYIFFGRMEGVLSRMAASRHTGEQLERLIAINNSIAELAKAADSKGTARNFRKMNRSFHKAIHEMANASSTLVTTVESLWTMSDFLMSSGTSNLFEARLPDASEQHNGIIAALEARDEEGAELEMQRHVEDTVRAIVGQST